MASVDMGARNQVLDIAKGIGIILVFLGHSLWKGGLAFGTIFNFHMPLFFFISGMLFKPWKYASSLELFKHVVVAFLIPYIFFSTLGLLTFWLSPRFPHDLRGVLSLVYSIFVGCHPRTNGPTWFLIVLAEVQLMAWLVLKASNGNSLALLLYAVLVYVIGSIGWSLWLPRFSQNLIPFRFLSAMLAFLYFAFGYVVAKCDLVELSSRCPLKFVFLRAVSCVRILKFLVVVLVVLVMVFLTHWFGRNSIVDYPWHPFLFIVTSMLGVIVVLTVSREIVYVDRKMWGWLSYIGRNSLYYFVCEMVVGLAVWRVMAIGLSNLSWPFYACHCHQGISILYCVLNVLAVSAVLPVVRLCYTKIKERF